MSGYTIDHIIDECAADKSSRFGISKELYYEAWYAMNKWIEIRLAKKKGANIPLLGSLTWEKVSNTVTRPIFLIDDSFVKLHRVKKPRVFTEPNTVPSEEANYSQLAIKYSKTLTKDMVFVGIRDIVKKIGEYVDRMYEFEVAFSVGTLRANNLRKVKFDFNLARLSEILPDAMRQTDNVPETSRSGDSTARSTASGAGGPAQKPYRVPSLPLSNTMTATDTLSRTMGGIASSTGRDSEGQYSERASTAAADFSNTGGDSDGGYGDENGSGSDKGNGNGKNYEGTMNSSFKMERPLSPAMQTELVKSLKMDELIPLGSTYNKQVAMKRARKAKACNMVQEQAFLRCLDGMAVSASHEDSWQQEAELLRQEQTEKEKQLKEKQKSSVKMSQEQLKKQIADAREESARQKMERRMAEFKFHIGSENSGYVEDVLCAKTRKQNTLISALEQQIADNHERREKSRLSKRQEEKEYLDHVAMEIDMKNVADHMAHLEKQQTLLSSWERDGHLRNLKRLQGQGLRSVHQYISTNVADEIDPEIVSRTTNLQAIGFDTRKK